jgi:hypothetical protein
MTGPSRTPTVYGQFRFNAQMHLTKMLLEVIDRIARTGAVDQLRCPLAKVQVKGEDSERFLWLDLTQFDVERRIPP